MVDFCLSIGDANAQDTTLVLLSLGSVLQGVFFIITILMVKKENASNFNKTHSRNHHRKRR